MELAALFVRLGVNIDEFRQMMTAAESRVETSAQKLDGTARRTESRLTQLQRGFAENQARTANQGFSRVEAALVRHTDRIEREFRANAAAIKDSLARGFITAQEAEAAGRKAAAAYNRGMTKGIDFASRQGIINFSGQSFGDPRSQAVYTQLAGSLKQVDSNGRSARVTMNTVRSSITAMAASAMHAAPGVTQVSSALGALALGTGTMVAVMGGIAAVTLLFSHLTREARENKKAVKEAIDEIERLSEARRWGAMAQIGPALGRALGEREVERIKIQNLERLLAQQQKEKVRYDPQGNEIPSGAALTEQQLKAAQRRWKELNETVRKGEAEAAAIRQEGAERTAKIEETAFEKAQRELQQFIAEYTRDWQQFHDGLIEIEERRRFRGQTETEARFNAARGQGTGAIGPGGRAFALPPDLLNAQDLGFDTSAIEDLFAQSDKGAGAMGRLNTEVDKLVKILKALTPGYVDPPKQGVVGTVRDKLTSMIDPKMLATNLATGMVSGVLSTAIGKFSQALRGMLSESASDRVRKENTLALQRLRDGVARLDASLRQVSGTNYAGLRSTAIGAAGLPSGSGSARDRAAAEAQRMAFFNAELQKIGLTFEEAQRIAAGFGIQLTGSAESMEAFAAAIGQIRVGDLLKSTESQIDLLRKEFQLFGTPQTEQLKRLRQFFLDTVQLPDDIEAAIGSADLNTREGRDAFRARLQETFRNMGEFTVEQLGGLTTDQFIDFILEMAGVTDSLDEFGNSIRGVTALLNEPRGFKVALARFNASNGIVPMGGLPGGGSIGGPVRGGGPVIIQEGAFTIVQRPDEDGVALAKRVAGAVAGIRSRGGTTAFDLQ